MKSKKGQSNFVLIVSHGLKLWPVVRFITRGGWGWVGGWVCGCVGVYVSVCGCVCVCGCGCVRAWVRVHSRACACVCVCMCVCLFGMDLSCGLWFVSSLFNKQTWLSSFHHYLISLNKLGLDFLIS